MIVVIVIFALMIVFMVIGVITSSHKEKQRQAFKTFYVADREAGRALDYKKPESVKSRMIKLDMAYDQSKDYLNNQEKEYYRTTRKDLSQHYKEVETERWARKADKYLEKFEVAWSLLVNAHPDDDFKDAEMLMNAKKRCISAWQSYFAIDLEEYDVTIYPKKHLKEYMGSEYEPCMESHDTLEKRLAECVQTTRPEYKRKMRLYDMIVDRVRQENSIARADLLRCKFDGFIEEEVKCCYRELIKKNRLVEIKMGGKYFVSLSDKEKTKKK